MSNSTERLDELWERHRERIEELYCGSDAPTTRRQGGLDRLAEIMKETQGFKAT